MLRYLTLILILFTNTVWAHPHVWVESRLSFNKAVVHAVWQFDEMFSNVMYSDYDIDGDKQFTGLEAKKLKSEMFDNLSNFGYFFIAYCGNAMLDVGTASNFKASSDGVKVTYQFDLPIKTAGCKQPLEIYNFDETYYTDITVKSVTGGKSTLKSDMGGRQFVELQ
jgi:ABC-type uncharacterized transport system substrate-binding protein